MDSTPLPYAVNPDTESIPSQEAERSLTKMVPVADIPPQQSSTRGGTNGLSPALDTIPNQASMLENTEDEPHLSEPIPPQSHAARSPYTYCYSPDGLAKNFKKLKKEQGASLLAEKNVPLTSTYRSIDYVQDDDTFVVAAIQLTAGGLETNQLEGFWHRAQKAVQEAAEKGANLVLLPELFLGPYFCQTQEACLMDLAMEDDDCFVIERMQTLAKRHSVVLPISFFERCGNALYNSVVMIDADGTVLGKYRKSHIPDGPGYQEKFYFTPGDTGFKVWKTRFGAVGVGICWDQWFPEAARSMAVMGADIILYPTAIGTEPQDSTIDSADHWQRVMQGHAAANVSVLVTS
jgi:N-carbamoylputrescine amidase